MDHSTFKCATGLCGNSNDISTNQWSVATLPGAVTGTYTATAVNGKVYFAGGNYNGVVHIYDNNTDSWSSSTLQLQWQQQNNAIGANPFTSFAVGDSIYWAGIVDEGNIYFPDQYTGRIEVQNTISNTTTIKCFPFMFSQHPVFKNNEVVLFDSYLPNNNASGGATQFFPIYNITTGAWSIAQASFTF
jgi:hypothetical protein